MLKFTCSVFGVIIHSAFMINCRKQPPPEGGGVSIKEKCVSIVKPIPTCYEVLEGRDELRKNQTFYNMGGDRKDDRA